MPMVRRRERSLEIWIIGRTWGNFPFLTFSVLRPRFHARKFLKAPLLFPSFRLLDSKSSPSFYPDHPSFLEQPVFLSIGFFLPLTCLLLSLLGSSPHKACSSVCLYFCFLSICFVYLSACLFVSLFFYLLPPSELADFGLKWSVCWEVTGFAQHFPLVLNDLLRRLLAPASRDYRPERRVELRKWTFDKSAFSSLNFSTQSWVCKSFFFPELLWRS